MSHDVRIRMYVDQLLQEFQVGLEPYVVAALQEVYGEDWRRVVSRTPNLRMRITNNEFTFDATALVRVMTAHWETCFARHMTMSDKALIFEIRNTRNRWAHHGRITPHDVVRLADTLVRVLQVVHAPNIAQMIALRDEIGAMYYAPSAMRWFMHVPKWAWLSSLLFVVVLGAGGLWWWSRPVDAEVPDTIPTMVDPIERPLEPMPTLAVKIKPLVVVVTATALPVATATPDAGAATLASFPCAPSQIKGNGETMIYHPPDGMYYAVTRNASVVCFDREEDALAAGYRKSKR